MVAHELWGTTTQTQIDTQQLSFRLTRGAP
jgi:hypothetical protein